MKKQGSIGARLGARAVLLAVVGGSAACGSEPPVASDPLTEARRLAARSTDGEVLGRWLFSELVAPGGEPSQATKARAALDALTPRRTGVFASMARAIDDESHGRLVAASSEYLDAVDAARTDEGPEAGLVGWYAANRLVGLRESVPHLWERAKPVVERATTDPQRIGFRARNELVDYLVSEESAESKDVSWEKLTQARSGCALHALSLIHISEPTRPY